MEPTTAKLRYHGTGGSLFGLTFVNAFLTGITFGFYSAWARNKVRQFHWSHTELDGDRFAYHGTGGELFVGYLKAWFIIAAITLVFGGLESMFGGANPNGWALLGVALAFYVALFVLTVYAVNAARRYRLSRSSWRGIRFSFHGDGDEFLGLMTRGTLLSIITLGFYNPRFQNQRREFFVKHVRFGSEPFMYDGDHKPLVPRYVKAFLLTIPTLGLSWIWYSAFKQRHFWNHTYMRGARFQSTVTGRSLVTLHVTNVLLVIVTFGLFAPWAIVRMHQYWCDNLSLVGTVEWASIRQRAQRAPLIGEGLAEGLDVDVGIGM